MTHLKEISYKIIFRSPMLVVDSFFRIGRASNLIIPASILKGATRTQFSEQKIIENSDSDLNLLFGDQNLGGNCFFSDAECTKSFRLQSRNFISTNPTSGIVDDGSLYSQQMIPVGAEFVGKVAFTEKTSGFQRSVALSRIMNISNLGSRGNLGFGECDIQLLN